MTQKISISKNKKNILLVIFLFTIALVLIVTLISKKYNYSYFIKKIENNSGFDIVNNNDYNINFLPKINFEQSGLEISKNTEDLSFLSREVTLKIVKEYLNWRKTIFSIHSPSTVINGIPLRNVMIDGEYEKSNIKINNYFSKINNGDIEFNGNIELIPIVNLSLKGNFNNIPLITLLNQSQKIDWKRLDVKIRSNFSLKSKGKNELELIENLDANIPIKGLFYINSTQEERFGTALLNLLTAKIPKLDGISKSLDYIFTKYADIPSKIEGLITINKGILETNDLRIFNDNAKMTVDMKYYIIKDQIDGNLFFYNKEKIYLKAKLEGSIEDPKILIGGKPFIENNEEGNMQDIKKIIEDGITNIFQKLLENNN